MTDFYASAKVGCSNEHGDDCDRKYEDIREFHLKDGLITILCRNGEKRVINLNDWACLIELEVY